VVTDHLSRSRRNALTQLPLRRDGELRDQVELIESFKINPAARTLISSMRGSLLRRLGDTFEVEFVRIEQTDGATLSYLGEYANAPLFSWFLSPEDEARYALPLGAEMTDLRWHLPLLKSEHGGLAAYARGLGYWQSRQRFCGACGSATVWRSGGHRAVCPSPVCAQEYFPRLDPAMIVLVQFEDACLLGRQAAWPARRYSTLAGFVEIGESLEEAVEREVMEEAGVALASIHYHSSQPWPFPSSLMLGYSAQASSFDLNVGAELEHARWWRLGEFEQDVRSGELKLPPRTSISYRLISDWYEELGAGSLSDLQDRF